MAAFLSTLPLKERPVLCVLTKCDLFSEAALGRMEEYLRESARRQLGLAGAQICRVYRAQGAPPAAQFVRAQAQRADALRAAQARRLLADGAAPLARYLAARVQNSRLLAPELARKAEVMTRGWQNCTTRCARWTSAARRWCAKAPRRARRTAAIRSRRSPGRWRT